MALKSNSRHHKKESSMKLYRLLDLEGLEIVVKNSALYFSHKGKRFDGSCYTIEEALECAYLYFTVEEEIDRLLAAGKLRKIEDAK